MNMFVSDVMSRMSPDSLGAKRMSFVMRGSTVHWRLFSGRHDGTEGARRMSRDIKDCFFRAVGVFFWWTSNYRRFEENNAV